MVDPASASRNVPDRAESFDRHILASICEVDDATLLLQAADGVKASCDEFVPAG